jgi:type III pantothenate kinase
MNLIVDIGNSSTKLALFDRNKKLSVSRIKDLDCAEVERMLTGFQIEKAIISSVREVPGFINDLLFVNIPHVHILTYKSRLPFRIEYDTPETLGTDRIAGVTGAFRLFPGKELMVIDAGTAITYDYLSDRVFKGGNISPGLNTRFRALNSFTGRLPLVTLADNYTNPGKNTTDSILAGVITGITYEINEYIRTFEKNSTDYKILLTGGEGEFLKDKITHQVAYMPDIVIDGLNYILEYNAV